MSYWTTQLPSWPTGTKFNQLQAVPWDGESAGGTNATDDCGPTSVSAATYWTTGVYIPSDSIMDAMKGQGYKGLTTEADLRGFLSSDCSIPTTDLQPNNAYGTAGGSLLNLEWAATVQGHPLIALRWWSYPNSGYRHWCCVVGLDPTYVTVFDPWTGTLVQETYQKHGDMYQGVLFSLDRGRDSNLP